jgi:hypothetical protein
MEYAMVQAIENRADVEGRILALKPDTARPKHTLVTVEVSAANPVQGYPNLFARTTGSPLEVILPAHLAIPLKIGAMVRCRIRRASPTAVFAENCTLR